MGKGKRKADLEIPHPADQMVHSLPNQSNARTRAGHFLSNGLLQKRRDWICKTSKTMVSK